MSCADGLELGLLLSCSGVRVGEEVQDHGTRPGLELHGAGVETFRSRGPNNICSLEAFATAHTLWGIVHIAPAAA